MNEVIHNLFRLLGSVLTSCSTDPTLITSGQWSGQSRAWQLYGEWVKVWQVLDGVVRV